MPVMIQHLDYAEANLQRGDVAQALAYSDSVMMDRTQRVFIDTTEAGIDQIANAEAAAREAIAMWQDALPASVNVVFVPTRDEANIVFLYQRSVVVEGIGVAGNVKWWRTIEPYGSGFIAKVRAEIRVRTVRPDGRPMSRDLMRHTSAHEFGHILGLADSDRVGDLMGPLDLEHPVKQIPRHELEALKSMHERAQQVRSQCLLLVGNIWH